MTNKLKTLLADADALTEDAREIDRLAREFDAKRAEIIDELTGLGIKVTIARKMVARIECEVVLPDGAEDEQRDAAE